MQPQETAQLGTIQAWIEVDGVPTESYAIEKSQDGKTITCWVASQSGKSFSVHWKDISNNRALSTAGHVSVDGVSSGTGCFIPGTARVGALPFASIDGFLAGAYVKPFCFSSVELTDDDAYLGKPDVTNLGKVQLAVRTVSHTGETRAPAIGVAAPSAVKLHERSKKGLAHCVTGGNAVPVALTNTIDTYYVPDSKLAFNFKYRSLDILQANGIAPPNAKRAAEQMENSPGPDDAPVASGSKGKGKGKQPDEDRIASLQAELKSLQHKNKKVKREGGSSGMIDLTAGVSGVKKERTKYVVLEGGIIDLT